MHLHKFFMSTTFHMSWSTSACFSHDHTIVQIFIFLPVHLWVCYRSELSRVRVYIYICVVCNTYFFPSAFRSSNCGQLWLSSFRSTCLFLRLHLCRTIIIITIILFCILLLVVGCVLFFHFSKQFCIASLGFRCLYSLSYHFRWQMLSDGRAKWSKTLSFIFYT